MKRMEYIRIVKQRIESHALFLYHTFEETWPKTSTLRNYLKYNFGSDPNPM